MPIRDVTAYPGYAALQQKLRDMDRMLQVLKAAHFDLTNYAAWLRDSANVEIWTEAPSDRTRYTLPQHFSAEGWRATHVAQRQWMIQAQIDHGADLQTLSPAASVALQDYLDGLPAVATAWNAAMAAHTVGGRIISEPLTQPERDALATAIEASLE